MGVDREARAVLGEFTRDGRPSPGSLERAGWGDWGQATPAWVLLLGLKALVALRWEDGRTDPQPLSGAASGLSRDEVAGLLEVLRGNLSAARIARENGTLTFERVLALLACVIAEEALTDEEVAELMELALSMNEETLRTGDWLRPPYRGVDVGPWDVSEEGWQALDLLDLGGLRVPRRAVTRFELNALPSGAVYVEAVLVRDRTASVQLQAFRTSGEPEWEQVRTRLEADIRGRGGEVEQWSGRAGVELRAVVPVVSNAQGRDSMTIRFLGCDGPGWLLRGW